MTAFDADARPVLDSDAPLTPADEASYPLHERRKHERKPTKDLRCLLGEVLDISEGGAMIHHRGKPTRQVGHTFAALLRHEALCVVASMRVARVERVGFRRFVMGVEFVGLDDQQRHEIAQIAAAAHNAFIGPQAYVEAA